MTSPDRLTLEYVVPRMYVALPKVGEADVNLSVDDSPVERRFAADLILFYAFDLDTHYQIVAHRDLPRLGITEDELHDRAVANLRALHLDIRSHKGDRIHMITAGGNYEAVLPLLSEICDSIESLVNGSLIAAIPARDILYITGDKEREDLADLRRWTSRMIEIAEKPLSRAFLRWDGKSWSEYSGYGD